MKKILKAILPPKYRYFLRKVLSFDVFTVVYCSLGKEKFRVRLREFLSRTPRLASDVLDDSMSAYNFFGNLAQTLEHFKVDLVIDAGAHSGQFASSLLGYGDYHGKVISFEPISEFYTAMKDHTQSYPNWRCLNRAVGEVSGAAKINVGGGHGGTSSLLESTDNLKALVSDDRVVRTEDIEVIRIDEFLNAEGIATDTGIMLKLDVQGFEMSAMKSCGDWFRKFSFVLVEVSSAQFYKGQDSVGDLCQYLEEQDFFLVSTLNNFNVGNGLYYDFDFLFCNRSLSKLERHIK